VLKNGVKEKFEKLSVVEHKNKLDEDKKTFCKSGNK